MSRILYLLKPTIVSVITKTYLVFARSIQTRSKYSTFFGNIQIKDTAELVLESRSQIEKTLIDNKPSPRHAPRSESLWKFKLNDFYEDKRCQSFNCVSNLLHLVTCRVLLISFHFNLTSSVLVLGVGGSWVRRSLSAAQITLLSFAVAIRRRGEIWLKM